MSFKGGEKEEIHMKGYCENCNDFVEYSIKKEKVKELIKDTEITYIKKWAICKECDEWFIPKEIMDENLKERELAFRRKNDLISVREIEKILEKYNIGKRPLSKVLGWGEITVTRYVDGDIPSNQYSEELKKINNNPRYFKEKLNKNKDKITETAFKKASKAVDDAIYNLDSNIGEDKSKIEGAVIYILKESEEITPLALQKLLYFFQGIAKAFLGKFPFKENCQAWQHGPVYKDIYFKYKEYGYNPISDEGVNLGEVNNLDETEREILDAILNSFGRYSGKVLEKITHNEKPWRETRKGLKETDPSDKIIEKRLIGSYFKEVKEKYNMLNIADLKDYCEDMYEKLYN